MDNTVKGVEIDPVREKLIAVFEESDKKCLNTSCDKCEYFGFKRDCTRMMEVDHLIAHGVTFATDNNVGSKWIPVTERLPEDIYERVLVKVDSCNILVGNPKIDTDRYDLGMWVRYGSHVTHWMPLPEPPKGE